MNWNQLIMLMIFISVYGAIALRNILRMNIPIWAIMMGD
jgi:hypothetical protein